MDAILEGGYYNKVITEISIPEVADITADYIAKKFTKFAKEDEKAEQQPFVVCSPVPVTLKVLPWLAEEPVVWQFTDGPYPMPLRAIIADAGNVETETGESLQNVQIGY